ncbi:DUF1835 domain-containing protein [Pokkaliibacter sp. CJK22405]|uniref:DUF1835 domain-containing protein n=1 Tax=Pokkaliibacter sp. CJK22405 TaxID=3384615 RepID=UPI0039853C8E
MTVVDHRQRLLQDIEQQCRRLLRGFDQDDALVWQRFKAVYPALAADFQPSMAEARQVLAAEAGFASFERWLERLLENGGLDSVRTRHLRCGHDIQVRLKEAGLVGSFAALTDPLCIGPLTQGLTTPSQFMDERAAYISETFDLALPAARLRLENEYQGLLDLRGVEQLVIWCEHDTYDQLSLAYWLYLLATALADQPLPRIELIAVDQVPGVEDFIGLGQLSAQQLRWLWQQSRRPLTLVQLEAGRQAWRALCQPEAESLAQLTQHCIASLPLLERALRRHLKELPASFNGLGLTQHLILQALMDAGQATASVLFSRLQQLEPMPYLGDAMLWQVLIPLWQSGLVVADPAAEMRLHNWHSMALSLSATGRQVLEGEVDYRSLMKTPRWVGGVTILPQGEGS